MGEQTLPGLQAHYWFAPDGDYVELRASLRFDRSEPGAPETLLALRDRLAGYDTGGWDAYTLVTSLWKAPVTAVSGGAALVIPIREFVESAVAALDREGDPVSAVELAFSLPKRAADLPGDIFELAVAFDLGDGAPRSDRKEPPPFRLTAQPRRFDEDVAGFAEAFETAWRSLDGGDGRLRLAAASGAGPPALWCVRVGGACGISIAAGANEKPLFLAVPPLSARLLAGTVPDVDGRGTEERFEGIELDDWWSIFGGGLERLAGAAQGGMLPAGAAYRIRRTTSFIAGLLADRLRPVAAGGADESAVDQARGYFRTLAQERPGGRPLLCSGRVAVARGDPAQGAPAPLLRGRTASIANDENAGAAGALVPLAAGEQRLLVALPNSAGARLPVPVRIEGGWIERDDGPSLFLLRAEDPDDALGLELHAPALPPLLRLPHPPVLASLAATGGPGAVKVGEALRWQVDVELAFTPALQDRLEVVLALEPSAEPDSRAAADGGALFEALARLVRFAVESPMPEKDSDPAALGRYLDLAEAAGRALAQWRATEADVPPMPAGWHYAVDFSDLPALVVTREPWASGQLPPWPSFEGFVTPAAEGDQARYEPEAGGEIQQGLRFAIPGLRLLSHRAVRVHARIQRNGRLAAPADPAFVLHSDIVSSGLLIPCLDWEATQPEDSAPSLAAALDRVLDSCAEGATADFGIVVGAELVRRIGGDPEVPVEAGIPLVLTPHLRIGSEAAQSTLADLKSGLAAAMAAARSELGTEVDDSALVLAVTLFDEKGDVPLARLRARLPVPKDDLGWWTGASGAG